MTHWQVVAPVVGWSIILWLIVAALTEPIQRGIERMRPAARGVVTFLTDSMNAVSTAIRNGIGSVQNEIVRAGNGVSEIIRTVEHVFRRWSDAVGRWRSVINPLVREIPDPTQRVLGAILYLAAVLIFLYTDAALGINSATSIFGRANVPLPNVIAPLRELAIPLVVAFMLNVFMLGVILADLVGITSPAPWPRSGRWHLIFETITIGNLALVIVLAACFGLALVVDLTPTIDPHSGLADHLDTIASIAMNSITVCAIITSFLLWFGIFGTLIAAYLLVLACFAISVLIRCALTFAPVVAPKVAATLAVLVGWEQRRSRLDFACSPGCSS